MFLDPVPAQKVPDNGAASSPPVIRWHPQSRTVLREEALPVDRENPGFHKPDQLTKLC